MAHLLLRTQQLDQLPLLHDRLCQPFNFLLMLLLLQLVTGPRLAALLLSLLPERTAMSGSLAEWFAHLQDVDEPTTNKPLTRLQHCSNRVGSANPSFSYLGPHFLEELTLLDDRFRQPLDFLLLLLLLGARLCLVTLQQL